MYLLILITCFPGNVAILQGEIIQLYFNHPGETRPKQTGHFQAAVDPQTFSKKFL